MAQTEFWAGGILHRTRDLCAYDQFKLLQTIMVALPALTAMNMGLVVGSGFIGVSEALAPLDYATDDEIAATFAACAEACERHIDDAWVPATKAMPMSAVMALVMAVASENFGTYFAMTHPEFRPAMGQLPSFEPVFMPDNEDWFWRPIEEKIIPMIGATDGVHKIWHFAKANDLLVVRAENESRAHNAAKAKG